MLSYGDLNEYKLLTSALFSKAAVLFKTLLYTSQTHFKKIHEENTKKITFVHRVTFCCEPA